MRNLFDIDQDIYDLLTLPESEIVDEDGVVLRDVWKEMEALQGERADKLVNCMLVVQELEADAAALLEQEAKLHMRADSLKNRAKAIKERVAASMASMDEKRVENAKGKVIRTTSKSVEIVDDEKLPDIFYRYKITKEADKKLIKTCISNGEEVPGAILKENNSVRLK